MNRTGEDYIAVIVHYRDPLAVTETIETLRDQTRPPNAILVVDNSAHDIPALPPVGVQYLPMSSNLGYAAAVNASQPATSEYPWLLVVTQDARLERDAIERMFDAAHDSSADCIGPRLYFRSDPGRVFSAGGRFTLGCRPVHDRSPARDEDRKASSADWVDGAILLLRRHALDRIGWFDESYFLYFEEVDLCTRLGLGKVVVANRATAYQEPGNFTAYLHLRNQILFWRRNGRDGRIALATMYQAVRSLAAIAAKRRGTIRGIVLGIYDGIKDTGGPPRAR